MRIKKLSVIILVTAFMLQIFPLTARGAPVPATPSAGGKQLDTNAASAVLMDAYSGKILYEKEPHKHVAPASVTKIMTMLLAFDAIHQGKVKWDDRVVASEAAWELGGSQIWLEPGEEFSLREMLIAIAVGSANDCCVAVAEHISGSQEAFVEMMNQKAKQLGLKDTRFVNCYGLPAEGHYTSAYDMAVIAREAIKYPDLLQLTSIKRYEKIRNGRPILDNTNKLLWWYRGSDGLKTGWTTEAKYCLVSTVERDKMRLIASVFGVPEVRGHFRESIKLYNWGFANYRFQEMLPQGKVMANVKVGKGVADQVAVVTPQRVGQLVKKGEEKPVAISVRLPRIVNAPLDRGERIGSVVLTSKGRVIQEIPLVAADNVAKGSLGRQIKKSLRSLLL